ncbi:hypothetical protein ATCC90586_005366 [Pythium insidiosum]|nr:hypothetical protein ATCC90586_005366 [Pythium insidiosum]
MATVAAEAAADDPQRSHGSLRRQLTWLGEVERDHAFSWVRCAVSIFSYALLLSDALRSGFAVRSLAEYPQVEPDTIAFGPFAYPVVHLTRANRSDATRVPVWLYKYDTTSIAMRSLVTHLAVADWPRCLLSESSVRCDDEQRGLSGAVTFSMIDSLVQAIRSHPSPATHLSRRRRVGHVTLRLQYVWSDRFTHLLFPSLFRSNPIYTCQALHFTRHELSDPRRPVCGPREPRPLGCDDGWVNLARQCKPPASPLCRDVHHVYAHTIRRLEGLQARYPNATIDLVVVEGLADFTRGALTFNGRRAHDIVVLARMQECHHDGAACETVAVDDFRYEGALETMSVVDWFALIATLRVFGQCYAWCRIALLVGGAFSARSHRDAASAPANVPPTTASLGRRCVLTLRTVLLVPSQVIIYGSWFPIACYVLAHLLDASTMQMFITRHFNTPLANYRFNLGEMVRMSSVSMRSVWLFAALAHVWLLQRMRHPGSASPAQDGLPGIPEFLITIVAASTVFAQCRALSWRDSRVLQVHEVVPSARRGHIRSQSYDNTRGVLARLVAGVAIDLQFLFVWSLALWALFLVMRWPRKTTARKLVFARTWVPFSAGSLWPVSGLVICWFDGVSGPPGASTRRSSLGAQPILGLQHFLIRIGTNKLRQVSMPSTVRQSQQQSARHVMASLEARSRHVESMIFLFNLAMMTDPLVISRHRLGSGIPLGLYEAKRSQRRYVLPLALAGSEQDVPIDWEALRLVAVFNSAELSWWMLLQSG